MKFLVDNALSPIVAERLRREGYDAVHVRDYHLQTDPDDLILARALTEGRILVSADTDFAMLLAQNGESAPSIVIFRRGTTRHPDRQADILLANLASIEQPLQEGAVVVIEDTRIRVRQLPITGA
ncbi:MAG TPA: DUF5615 family PIN-like protein [Stellaceae bacterium]|nr:DUF5615 family PIN-like protein [Stellaceae bacterium]